MAVFAGHPTLDGRRCKGEAGHLVLRYPVAILATHPGHAHVYIKFHSWPGQRRLQIPVLEVRPAAGVEVASAAMRTLGTPHDGAGQTGPIGENPVLAATTLAATGVHACAVVAG